MYRINELLKLDRKLYHTNDLATLWGVSNRHNLYMTITRYVDRGILYPVFKGLYSTVPLSQLNPLELGKAIIHRYTYLTTESVLSRAGIISQTVYDYTFVADQSKRVSIGGWSFRFRKLKDEVLYHPSGIENQDGIFIASVERAVADMLYFNPEYHFDLREAIDFDKVKSIQKEIGTL